MQHTAPLPLLGDSIAWSLLDMHPRLPPLYHICRGSGGLEVTGSAFAEATLSTSFDIINGWRIKNGQPAYQFDFVSQQPPSKDSKRRIDFQIRSWARGRNGELTPFVLAHVEVKRHNARPSEVEELENQIITAFEQTAKDQRLVYGIAFHGTSVRVWRWTKGVLHSMTGYDSHDVEDKANWIDAGERGRSIELLGAFLAIVKDSPFQLEPKIPMRMPDQQIWDRAGGFFPPNASRVPIPRSAIMTGEIVYMRGQYFRLPTAAIDPFKATVIDVRRPPWGEFAKQHAISNPEAYTAFEKARRYAKENRHDKARKAAAAGFRAVFARAVSSGRVLAAAGPSRSIVVAGPSRTGHSGAARMRPADSTDDESGDDDSEDDEDDESENEGEDENSEDGDGSDEDGG